jgi:hypothetical protein
MMDVFWTAIYVYGGIGGAIALGFVLVGIDRVDQAAHGAYLVRPLLLPGLILLWPIVLVRWIVLERCNMARPR